MKPSSKVLFKAFLIFLVAQSTSAQVVRIPEGEILGSVLQSRFGINFNAFRGIPYAEPPIDDLRFKAPVPKRPWQGQHDGRTYGSMCMQETRVAISEDCLFLNVFTRTLPSPSNPQLKPVIAFLHGGGFELGAGDEYQPEYLMEREVVLVTINYRLGVFGFLAVETEDIPGNAAMKDQTLALKWIQNNIHLFGGDPTKVTLAGLSAGAHAATAHMLSPMSQGLFDKVIAMSGGMAWQVKLKKNNIESARALSQKINCPTGNVNEMVQCLKEKPAAELASNMVVLFLACPVMTWQPVVEEAYGQEERFLTDQPVKLLEAGNFSRVNVMIGITSEEFVYPIADLLNNVNYTRELNERFDEIAPTCFSYEGNDHKSTKEIGDILRGAYLPYDTIDIRSFTGLKNLISDGIIGIGVHRFVHYISNFTDVYYYRFSYTGRFSRFYATVDPVRKPYGVHHIDDIQYMFYAAFMSPMFGVGDPEHTTVERMTRIWEQFATTGNPNNATDPFLADMNWPKHDAEKEFFLDIGTHLVEKNGLFLNRFKVWESLDINSSSLSIKANFLIILIALLKIFF